MVSRQQQSDVELECIPEKITGSNLISKKLSVPRQLSASN